MTTIEYYHLGKLHKAQVATSNRLFILNAIKLAHPEVNVQEIPHEPINGRMHSQVRTH